MGSGPCLRPGVASSAARRASTVAALPVLLLAPVTPIDLHDDRRPGGTPGRLPGVAVTVTSSESLRTVTSEPGAVTDSELETDTAAWPRLRS
jgi:hypothetical protein